MFLTATIFAGMGSFGISSGAHRLWAHKTYKANMKMKAMLLFFQTLALQNSVIEWVRDHRVHHKFSDTNADPHNSQRGFFFSHMGWLMCRKHPDVTKFGEKVDMSDLTSDPMLRLQHKWEIWLNVNLWLRHNELKSIALDIIDGSSFHCALACRCSSLSISSTKYRSTHYTPT